jgi:electron transport complex protein RnfC
MLDLKMFKKGGVHPKSRKEITRNLPVENSIVPKIAKVSMHQHIGTPAKCIVKKDDVLVEGQLIGQADGFISACIHSPVSGKVLDVVKEWGATGLKCETVYIAFEGAVGQGFGEKRNWESLKKEEILKIVKDAGIVGLGGAMFPTHVKLSPPEGKKIEYLLINGVECEPYLTADFRIMLEKRNEVIEGIKIAKKLVGAEKVIIGIENDKMDAAYHMDEGLKNIENFDVAPLKVRYPQGGEKQLIEAVIGKEVPEGKIPLDIGVVVMNVGTAFALYEAVVKNKPLYERVVTVTGTLVEKPGNYKVRIGTSVKDLLEDCGLKGEAYKVIMGGPMMGMSLMNTDIPVIKGTSGILVLSKKEAKKFSDNLCIKCGMCVSACPVGLMPQLLVENLYANRYETAVKEGLLNCIECGCCSYVCPAKIHLVQYFKAGKLWHRSKISYTDDKTPIIR